MIAFGTVIYNGALPFFDEFIDSINRQTGKDFELLIINDGVEDSLLKSILINSKIKYYIVSNSEGLSPADLRVKLIEESKERGYELLVIGDSDDIFDSKRVECLYEAYKRNSEYSFYYNQLLRFDSVPVMTNVPEKTFCIEQLLQHNYIGMSNSSINLNAISFEFIDSLKGFKSFVFDWYLFSRILCSGGKGLFVEDAITYYRIYEENFAGLNAELEKELKVKENHYSMMAHFNPIYKPLLDKLLSFDLEKRNIHQTVNSFWWDKILL